MNKYILHSFGLLIEWGTSAVVLQSLYAMNTIGYTGLCLSLILIHHTLWPSPTPTAIKSYSS